MKSADAVESRIGQPNSWTLSGGSRNDEGVRFRGSLAVRREEAVRWPRVPRQASGCK